jgi:thiosulfate dehydrogenase (quinone) large subunit
MSGTDGLRATENTVGRGTESAATPEGAAGAGGASGGAGGAHGGVRALAGRYALLPLRVFLGVTFIYAGLDKLTDSAFFGANGQLVAMMHAVHGTAAIPGLVDLALKAPTGFGYAIALGELAAGLGTLFGLLSRIAALGGALISLSLWLTVSWASTPYYYGNDLAYLMAWLPLTLAGAPYLSLDALLARRRPRG